MSHAHNPNPAPGIDWDGELQALMEASGIEPRYADRPTWTTRIRRRLHTARPVLFGIGVTGVGMWWVAHAGAPAAATVPLLVWLTGWIGYWVWIGFGRPDTATTAHTLHTLTVHGFRAGSRFAFRHSRPARARWRAWQAARARDRAAAVRPAPATTI
ncbi:Uncharacterised protein [Nocardia otitidiscaviarum]|uniref:Uncharacterized protein n=1 Tax=Nocardia otitidiscaviarum TaxID=1823 RepID=A0A378YTF9_9NOCA|nr:hypothetical protein [Nocardia otitidiscaviarum]SUA80414.1 Uncharacterised protein [Nocardia otitidiscaviarum]